MTSFGATRAVLQVGMLAAIPCARFVVHGTLRKRAAAVRLARVGALEIEQSLLGRLLGYGTIVAGELEIDYAIEIDNLLAGKSQFQLNVKKKPGLPQ